MGRDTVSKSSTLSVFFYLRCLFVLGSALMFIGRGQWGTFQTKASVPKAVSSEIAGTSVSPLVGENQIEVENKVVATVRSLKTNVVMKATKSPTFRPTTRLQVGKPVKRSPTSVPTGKPTTRSPTRAPTGKPSTRSPTRKPTGKPSTRSPTRTPTGKPSTRSPTRVPTQNPSTASPVKTAVMVGAYYYPWYFGGAFHGGKVLRFFLDPQQPPLLGKYNMTDPAVILQHLMWSRKANIGLWATSWWGPRSREDTTTINVILNHSDIGQHKIALLYETNNRLRISGTNYSTAWIETDINHMCENYFSHPNYYQIDGRPVVFIYLTRLLSGMKILDSVLILMKAAAAKYNFDPYFIGDQVWSNAPSGTYAPFTQLDAVTSYDVRGGLRMNDTTNYVTQTRLNNYYSQQQGWKTAANSQGCAYVPPTSPGFNDRGVRLGSGHGAVSRRLSPDADPGSLFRASLKAAVALVDSRTNNLMMINSFNEWHEDTQIEPTIITNTTILPLNLTQGVEYEGYGEFYLDIVAAET